MTRTRRIGLLSTALTFVFAAGACFTPATDGDSSSEAATTSTRPITAILSAAGDASWHDLDDATRDELARLAERTLAAYRAEWGARGIADKTAKALAADGSLDDAASLFAKVVSDGAVSDVTTLRAPSVELVHRARVLAYAMLRDNARNDPAWALGDLDWDGVSKIAGALIPDRVTLSEQEAIARELAGRAEELLAKAPANERILLTSLRDRLRELASGHIGIYFGPHSPLQVTGLPYAVDQIAKAQAPSGGAVFATSEDFLLAVNAAWFADVLSVNVGSVDATIGFSMPSTVDNASKLAQWFGDTSSPAARGYAKLGQWWSERLQASSLASARCTIYDERERAEAWESYLAYATRPNPPASTLADLVGEVDPVAESVVTRYQTKVFPGAIAAAFPDDTLLSPAQRAEVLAKLARSTKVGAADAVITSALDEVTGDTRASDAFKAARASAPTIGPVAGPEDLTPAVRAQVAEIEAQIKHFFVSRYSGYDLDFEAYWPRFEANGEPHIATELDGSVVYIGLQKKSELADVYRGAFQVAYKAIARAAGKRLPGVLDSGATSNASIGLMLDLLTQVFGDKAPLYSLGAAPTDARYVAATHAVARMLMRDSCDANESDAITFVTDIANGWGISGDAARYVSQRANLGMNYLLYWAGDGRTQQGINYYQARVGDRLGVKIDAVLVTACDVRTFSPDPETADKLERCIVGRTTQR